MSFLGPRIWEVDVIRLDAAIPNVAINEISGITPNKENPHSLSFQQPLLCVLDIFQCPLDANVVNFRALS